MKGLDLAEAYYRDVGAAMVRERFGAFEGRIAVGLAGPGSECFGFDDDLSRDHDWGPGFCLWLTEEDHRQVGDALQRAYLELPAIYGGYGPRQASPGEEWRVGVCRTTAFFGLFTGLDRPPETPREWLRIPEQALATCTNGRVFSDPLGAFTRHRQALLDYYPDDVRLKKIASLCVTAAQTGQYNYLRSIRRGDEFAAAYSVVKFCTDALGLVFLLNRRYAPFYKWLHRAVRDLPVLGGEVHDRVGELMRTDAPEQKVELMESVARLLADQLRDQGLSDSSSDFLLDHAPRVQAHILDAELRERISAA